MKLSSITGKSALSTLKYSFTMLMANLHKKTGEEMWIISERENQARDN